MLVILLMPLTQLLRRNVSCLKILVELRILLHLELLLLLEQLLLQKHLLVLLGVQLHLVLLLHLQISIEVLVSNLLLHSIIKFKLVPVLLDLGVLHRHHILLVD